MRRVLNLAALVCGGVLGLVALFGLYEAYAVGGTDSNSSPKHAAAQENGGTDHRDEAATRVKEVLGGDTLRIAPAIDDANVVRLIGVDAPTAGKLGAGGQPYGQRTLQFAKSVLEGKKVKLKFDVERKDRYGRLLAYVYPTGGKMFNEVLLRKGYAQVYTQQPNDKHRREFAGEQDKAREGALGIWGLPAREKCKLANHGNGIGTGSPSCKARPNTAPKHESQQRKRTPAAPSGSSAGPDLDCSDLTYRQAQAEIAADASDPFNLDADGDGVACDSPIDKEATGFAAAPSAAASSSPIP